MLLRLLLMIRYRGDLVKVYAAEHTTTDGYQMIKKAYKAEPLIARATARDTIKGMALTGRYPVEMLQGIQLAFNTEWGEGWDEGLEDDAISRRVHEKAEGMGN